MVAGHQEGEAVDLPSSIKFSTPQSRAARRSQWKGLGDVIASATKALGVRPCSGCQKRQATLNKLVPFKRVDFPLK